MGVILDPLSPFNNIDIFTVVDVNPSPKQLMFTFSGVLFFNLLLCFKIFIFYVHFYVYPSFFFKKLLLMELFSDFVLSMLLYI